MQMTKTRKPPELRANWTRADEAFERGQQAYLDWCAEIAALYAAGSATQDQIAERYDSDQSRISSAIAIGNDKRLISNRNDLPRSAKTLYLLTTLPDADFEKLAKPTTTQAVILDYKRRLSAPKVQPAPPPARPKCPGVEGHGPGLWKWSDAFEEWVQEAPYVDPKSSRPPCPGVEGRNTGEYHWLDERNTWVKMNAGASRAEFDSSDSQAASSNALPDMSMRDWAVQYLKFCKHEKVVKIVETIRRCEFPDHGGSTEITKVCNLYLSKEK